MVSQGCRPRQCHCPKQSREVDWRRPAPLNGGDRGFSAKPKPPSNRCAGLFAQSVPRRAKTPVAFDAIVRLCAPYEVMKVTAPKHLRPATRRWFSQINELFALESHHLKLLLLAAEAWDRVLEAREGLAEHGLVYIDRHGSPRPRPEVAIEHNGRLGFAKLLREIDLDAEPPSDTRLPRLNRNRRP